MTAQSPETLLGELLNATARARASDLHLSADRVPIMRVDGRLQVVPGTQPLSRDDLGGLLTAVLGADGAQAFLTNHREVDLSIDYPPAGVRFRVNAYWALAAPAIALRAIPRKIPTLRELNLPETLLRFTEPRQGFVLIVGPSGHGKSTTMASLLDVINHQRPAHVITIEDPVEYVFTEDQCLIHQREVGTDTPSFPIALRAALREDPNVVMIGEMRDLETIATAMTLAETGHLVFASLHTNDAAQAIDRIVDAYPPESKRLAHVQLAGTLAGIVSLRLLPAAGGGLVPAVELLVATPAVRNLIREGQTAQIPGVIQTGAAHGMITLEQSLKQLVREGLVSDEDAVPYLSGW